MDGLEKDVREELSWRGFTGSIRHGENLYEELEMTDESTFEGHWWRYPTGRCQ